LAHPAHFHLFKNVISHLKNSNKVFVVYNDKDVLGDLIKDSDFNNLSIKVKTIKNNSSKFSLTIQFILKIIGAFWVFFKIRPDIVIGTPILIPLISVIIKFKSIIVNEDDFDIIKMTSDFGYPYATNILCPDVCRTGIFENKCIKYSGYHELAYLHPNNFNPSIEIAKKYIDTSKPYILIRFAKLNAHHDTGIQGLNDELVKEIIKVSTPEANIYITSEKLLNGELEKYRININPTEIHHVMAFSKLYIGDSQTMAAESAVLGVPFIRFNDFVGRISYLDELENKYKLGFGIATKFPKKLIATLKNILKLDNSRDIYFNRRKIMLNEKVDLANYMKWFFQNYPESINTLKQFPDYQNKFIKK